VVILAETVHQHAPLYSPLEDNCLWFIHIFCAVLEKLYACKTVHGDNRVSASQDIRIPRNNYLPNLAGRSMGILISKVEESIVSVVVANFLKFKEEMRADVRFIINSCDI
jgi:hypothetical protein